MSVDDDDDRRLLARIRELARSSSELDRTHGLTLELTYELKDAVRRIRRLEDRLDDRDRVERQRAAARESAPERARSAAEGRAAERGGLIRTLLTERGLVIGGLILAVLAGQVDVATLMGLLGG